ncbi:MAG: SRPBCC family protein [Thermomicrobiales bacterium]
MQLNGDYTLSASPQEVYQAMLDPEVLKACLPGCESLTEVGPDEYDAVMTIGIGMIKGRYGGHVKISDKNEPDSFTMLVEGKGPQGQIGGEGKIILAPTADGGTHLTWEGDANVRGVLARIGGRVIQPAAKTIVNKFFGELEDRFAAQTAGSATA